jgi:hypothetical protein
MRVVGMMVCTALIAVSIAAASRAPYTPPGADDAVLRLSWRLSVAAREDCRQRTEQELAALPAHMRTPEVCTRDQASYALFTKLNGSAADTVRLRRGGAKGDRPVFVLQERVLPPGRHRVVVELSRTAGDAAPEVLASLDTVLVLERGRVQLVTLAADGRTLMVRSGAAGMR